VGTVHPLIGCIEYVYTYKLYKNMRDRDIYFTLNIYMNMTTFSPWYTIYLLCFFILSVIIVLLKPSLLSISIQTMLTSFLNQSVSLKNWEDWFNDACSEGAINMYMYWTQTDSTVSSLNMYYLIVMYCCRCFFPNRYYLTTQLPGNIIIEYLGFVTGEKINTVPTNQYRAVFQ